MRSYFQRHQPHRHGWYPLGFSAIVGHRDMGEEFIASSQPEFTKLGTIGVCASNALVLHDVDYFLVNEYPARYVI